MCRYSFDAERQQTANRLMQQASIGGNHVGVSALVKPLILTEKCSDRFVAILIAIPSSYSNPSHTHFTMQVVMQKSRSHGSQGGKSMLTTAVFLRNLLTCSLRMARQPCTGSWRRTRTSTRPTMRWRGRCRPEAASWKPQSSSTICSPLLSAPSASACGRLATR